MEDTTPMRDDEFVDLVFCPDNPRICQFSGTLAEVEQHLWNIEKIKAELAAGIDRFISDTRR